MSKILIVDDEINIIKTLTTILSDEDHDINSAVSGEEALIFLKNNEVDLIILDVWLPDCDGVELINKINKINSEAAIIMISGHGSIDVAVKATHLGAYDFLEKPPSLERVVTAVNNALEQSRLKKENYRLKEKSVTEDLMIGESSVIKEINSTIETAAKTNARVFITGNSGTGKELIACSIFLKSERSNNPFVRVNCAAIPDELIESELFGHEKGAFTGAISRRLGKFEMADKGTLFLDEICDMSLAAQAKVLRVLQEQQFERVGGNETIKVDVRVIAATNVNVMEAIKEGKFREDLYYRLNVIPINSPSLLSRKDDIVLLIEYFIEKFSKEHGIEGKSISQEGLDILNEYGWPGNVRELKNIVERLLVMVSGEVIDVDDIKKYMHSIDDIKNDGISSLKEARLNFEKDFIIASLKENNKNITLTSKELGMERTNLHRKIKLHNIDLNKI